MEHWVSKEPAGGAPAKPTVQKRVSGICVKGGNESLPFI